MNIKSFTDKVSNKNVTIEFSETIALIDELYIFTPTEFKNGALNNLENQNNGSCKLFAFAKLQNYSKAESLKCFGKFYTEDVLGDPEGDNHQNIRNFMVYGWEGIKFKSEALKER